MKPTRPCPTCNSDEVKHLKSHVFDDGVCRSYERDVGVPLDFSFELFQCGRCSMVYVGNGGEGGVDMSNEFYRNMKSDRPEDDANFPTEARIESYATLLEDLRRKGAPASGRLLDFGCGFGGMIKTAMRAGYEVHGIEPCKFRAEWTSRELKVPVEPVFGNEVEMSGLGEFDLMVSDQVFEHLEDPIGTLAHLRGAIKPGGYIWLCTPNYNSRLFHEQVIPGHFNYFTPKTLTRLVREGGFEIVSNKLIVRSHGRVLPKLFLRYFGLGTCSVLARKPG